jgi:uncharacterized membrane protein
MENTIIKPHKSSFGIDANLAALATFVAMGIVSLLPVIGYFAWAVPAAIYLNERSSKFVKEQAATAFVIGVIGALFDVALWIILAIITPAGYYGYYYAGGVIGAILIIGTLSTIISIIMGIVTIFFVYQSWKYKEVNIPVITPLALKVAEIFNGLSFCQKIEEAPVVKKDDSKPPVE